MLECDLECMRSHIMIRNHTGSKKHPTKQTMETKWWLYKITPKTDRPKQDQCRFVIGGYGPWIGRLWYWRTRIGWPHTVGMATSDLCSISMVIWSHGYLRFIIQLLLLCFHHTPFLSNFSFSIEDASEFSKCWVVFMSYFSSLENLEFYFSHNLLCTNFVYFKIIHKCKNHFVRNYKYTSKVD